jgi:hypothetical protein
MKYFLLLLFIPTVFAQETADKKQMSFNGLAGSIKKDQVAVEEAVNVVKPEKKVEKKSLKESQEEKEDKVINYSGIKDVLVQDELMKEKNKKKNIVKKIKDVRQTREVKKYNYPGNNNFWSFMSEYWLVKNAQSLQWDFQKPQYGIDAAFRNLLEKLGYYNKKFKVLVINSPNLSHMALPANPNEYVFLISLPFMRTLDLTKVELSLLLLEDYFRSEMGYFQKNLKVDMNFLGDNFYGENADIGKIKKLVQAYNKVCFEQGFNFQQQFSVTKKMDSILRSDPALWSAYVKMLNKIDRLVKMNLLYKGYNKIYPSPELQIQWLTPKKKVL